MNKVIIVKDGNQFIDNKVYELDSEKDQWVQMNNYGDKDLFTYDLDNYLILKSESDKAQQFLNDTDWYCARKVEKGIDIPQDIKNARDVARSKVL